MVMKAIETYFKSNLYKPFYAVVGDEEYQEVKSKITATNDVVFIRLSNCCGGVDKKPNLDKLRETLRMADIDCDSNKIVLLGLGEYLSLEGPEITAQVLDEFITFNLGSAKAVFLLRGVAPHVKSMLRNDPRYAGRQIIVSNQPSSSLSFTFSSLELGMNETTGFQQGLKIIEDGCGEKILINTTLSFPNSTYSVQLITNFYDAVCKKIPNFQFSQQLGTDSYWEELLKEVNLFGSIEGVFAKHQFDVSLEKFYQNANGNEYSHWLYYIFLRTQKSKIQNTYLRFVIEQSSDFDDFKNKVLNAITSVSHKDNMFLDYYSDRKKLVSQYPESDIAAFVANNRFDPSESIYKLTDNTLVEKEEIIAYIAQHGIPDELEYIYPALFLYLKKYYFQCAPLSELLTSYFDEYKHQKISNVLSDEFLARVDKLAISRDYNRLRTRDELVASIEKSSSYLCWVDALGVEYLSYIIELAHKKGLAVSVSIGRSALPSITGINRKFYDAWSESDKRKVEELDDTKHKEKGGYKFGANNLYAIHLAKELEIISRVIDEAATMLGLRQYDRYVIASDHGASRLAVLRKKEEKYDTDTQGEHSGRCCKLFANYDLPFATEENGYVVLADYGRFKGSRAANVEVHGGASLEEVVVPVIVLSLRDPSINIKVIEPAVKADYNQGVTFTIYVNKTIIQQLSVKYNGTLYSSVQIDSNHYKVTIPEIKRACKAKVEVYLGEDWVSHITINVVGKSAAVNSDFDDLF